MRSRPRRALLWWVSPVAADPWSPPPAPSRCLATIYIVIIQRERVNTPQPLSCTICPDSSFRAVQHRCAPSARSFRPATLPARPCRLHSRGSDGRHPHSNRPRPCSALPGACHARTLPVPGALTCARQSVVTTARSTWMPRCSSGRSGRPAARVRPTCTVSPPARRPAATRQRPERPAAGAVPPRAAGAGVRRPLDVALDALPVAGSADWRPFPAPSGPPGGAVRPSATFGGHQRPRIGLNPP